MSEIRDYNFTLTGTTPLLMHSDDVVLGDELRAWRTDPVNKSVSVTGDDRSPAWSWQTYLYHDGEYVAVPQENLMGALRYAGSRIPFKGKSNFKAMSQSGLVMPSDFCEFRCNGEQIAIADIFRFQKATFSEHAKEARELGFELFIKRAKIGNAKHVRVRPKFNSWSVHGAISVTEPAITTEILEQMFAIAGRYSGIGDWRPSSKQSGPYGMFTSELSPMKAPRKGK